MKRDTIESFRLPFTIEEALEELRWVIWCSASQLALLGRSDLGDAMVIPDTDFGMNETPEHYLPQINLDAFDITETVRGGYNFAFQVNQHAAFSSDDIADLMSFSGGSVRHSWSGDPSPLLREESKLGHVADMVSARAQLMTDGALTIRHLSLLANMTEATVRSALSADGIKTEGRPASLPAARAEPWLRGRRGYVPTAAGKALDQWGTPDAIFRAGVFPKALEEVMRDRNLEVADLAQRAGLDSDLVTGLLGSEPTDVSVQSMIRIAVALFVNPEIFFGSYMRYLDRPK
ncbi:MAG: helix-turn-helix transcriptional regulator [bacterium]